MRTLFASRATTAAAVGVAVLLVAGGGYAVASGGGTITACAHKDSHALYTGRCKKGDQKLTWNQVGPPGPKGATGAAGSQGPQGNQGIQGNQGVAGTARAYGLVSTTGTLTRSAGVVSVTNPTAGIYCITLAANISPATTGAVVTPDYSTDSTNTSSITHVEFVEPSSFYSCTAPQIEVRTFSVSASTTLANTTTNEGFFFAVP